MRRRGLLLSQNRAQSDWPRLFLHSFFRSWEGLGQIVARRRLRWTLLSAPESRGAEVPVVKRITIVRNPDSPFTFQVFIHETHRFARVSRRWVHALFERLIRFLFAFLEFYLAESAGFREVQEPVFFGQRSDRLSASQN